MINGYEAWFVTEQIITDTDMNFTNKKVQEMFPEATDKEVDEILSEVDAMLSEAVYFVRFLAKPYRCRDAKEEWEFTDELFEFFKAFARGERRCQK